MEENNAKNSAENVGQSSRKSLLKWLVRLVVGLTIIAVLATRHDATSLLNALRGVPFWLPIFAVAFYLAGQGLCAWKWQLLLRAQNAQVPLGQCCRLYLVGMFWNLWMPTNIGGDVVRALRMAPFCGGKAIATSSVLVERLTGMAALILTAMLGLVFEFGLTASDKTATLAWRPIAFVVAFSLIFSALFFALRRVSIRKPASLFACKWRAFSDALALYSQPSARRALLISLLISVVFQISQVVLNIVLARQIGLNVATPTFFWLIPSLAIASLVPLGIGGLGVREVAAVQLLANSNASVSTILAWSLLWQATVWLASLPGVFWAAQRQRN